MNTSQQAEDEHFMRQALLQAQRAEQLGEVPVGAVVVRKGHIIAIGHNAPISQNDPSAHAEINALRAAAQVLGNYRLEDCTLYVTLEPCTMCSGALLQARLKRVVFGATEPRTGAAGSVHNVFGLTALNPHTDICGGVLASECAAVMQDFFKTRRDNPSPLREDALRTPETRFQTLPDFPWSAHYVQDLPSLKGLRMHWIDEGPRNGLTFLCLHDSAGWSYIYRDSLPAWVAAGHRVLLPDLIGFGKSDKPKKEGVHTFQMHLQILKEWVVQRDMQRVVLVLPGPCDALGLGLLCADPRPYVGLVTLRDEDQSVNSIHSPAFQAPFPDKGHRAALQPVRRLRQTPLSNHDTNFLQSEWTGRRVDFNWAAHTHGALIAHQMAQMLGPP